MSITTSQPPRHPGAGLPQASEPPPPPPLGTRALGWLLMTMSLGLVSCQSLFVL